MTQSSRLSTAIAIPSGQYIWSDAEHQTLAEPCSHEGVQ